MDAGNVTTGGLRRVVGPCPAILGLFRWHWCYYLLLATKISEIGKIRGHSIHGINGTALLPLSPPSTLGKMSSDMAAKEANCRRLLSLVTLTKDFFFSFAWDLWSTVQDVLTTESDSINGFDSDWVWNGNMTQTLRDALGHARWTVPLIHGFFEQKKVSILGQTLNITLIARRSRKFAGTRFLRRGVNEEGFVANDVEVEQIVEVSGAERMSSISSIVQRRGSVPLYWNQSWDSKDPSLRMKPVIKMLSFLDPFMGAARLHFEHLKYV